MTELEKATATYYKRQNRTKTLLIVFFAYLTILLTAGVSMSVYQTMTIADNQKTNVAASNERFRKYNEANAIEHEKTQQYVRCIGEALLKPVAERTASSFDDCGVKINASSVTKLKAEGIVPSPQKSVKSPAKSTTPPVEPKPAPAVTQQQSTNSQPQAETPATEAPVAPQGNVITRLINSITNLL